LPLDAETKKQPRSRSQSKNKKKSTPMNRVAAIVLGGGEGSRLFPLTQTRCKPAISFGGKYRLIDVPLSNCINSGCHNIFVLTQFLSSSLHQHIFRTYHRDMFASGCIELLPAEQKPKTKSWFQGTADAVRQNIEYFIEVPADYFLILSGDQLYNINFQDLLDFANETDADMIIATQKIAGPEAQRMGILKVDERNFVTDFIEKPQEKEILDKFSYQSKKAKKSDELNPSYLGSMGIYLFKREALLELLRHDPREDFGKHLIPTKVLNGGVAAYIYEGYWEDIGTIESFHKANINLTQPNPRFNCYDETNPLFTGRYNLPGPKITNCQIQNAIICEGSVVEAKSVSHSILGPRTVVRKGVEIVNSYLMGNDFYQPPVQLPSIPQCLEIGEDSIIRDAIIDKFVHIGRGVQLINQQQLSHFSNEFIHIRDGIIIVPRGTKIPDGFVL